MSLLLRRGYAACLFFSGVLLGPVASSAQVTPHPTTTTYRGQSVPQLVVKATAVFEGKVVRNYPFWNSAHNVLYTAHTVDIYKVFKGLVGPTVEIVTVGGLTQEASMGMAHGFGLAPRSVGLFFVVPFHETAHQPVVPPNQVYQVVDGPEGYFNYPGIPPVLNAADTPYVRYTQIETSLYPLVQQATGGPYRQLKSFDINRYNKIVERRGLDSQTLEASPLPARGSKKRLILPKSAPRPQPADTRQRRAH